MRNNPKLQLFHCERTNCRLTEQGCKKRWYQSRDPHQGPRFNAPKYSPCRTCDKWGPAMEPARHWTDCYKFSNI